MLDHTKRRGCAHRGVQHGGGDAGLPEDAGGERRASVVELGPAQQRAQAAHRAVEQCECAHRKRREERVVERRRHAVQQRLEWRTSSVLQLSWCTNLKHVSQDAAVLRTRFLPTSLIMWGRCLSGSTIECITDMCP